MGKTLVEKNFCREQAELEAQLFVIAIVCIENKGWKCGGGDEHGLVSSKVEQSLFKVFEGEVVTGKQKVGDTALEISGRAMDLSKW